MVTLDAPPGVRRPLATAWLLRLLATAHAAVVLAQPLLAGQYLAGDVDAIGVHGLLGNLVPLVAVLLAVGAVAHVAVARAHWWLLPAVVVLFLAEGVQVGMGHSRILAVHVPLGVLTVVAAVLLVVWAWTPAASRPRRRGAER